MGLILFNEFGQPFETVVTEHDIFVSVILHDFEDLNLNEFKTATITVNEISEEIEKFRLVVRVVVFLFDSIAHELNEFKDLRLIVEHVFIVVVHFFKEVNTAYIFLDVGKHFGDLIYHSDLDFVEVLNQGHDKFVAQV